MVLLVVKIGWESKSCLFTMDGWMRGWEAKTRFHSNVCKTRSSQSASAARPQTSV